MSKNASVSLSNVGQNISTYSARGRISNVNIFTTRDRAALVFQEYVRCRMLTAEWIAFLGVFLGLLIPLMTVSEFRGLFVLNDKPLVTGAMCKAFTTLLCIASGVLCVVCIIRRWKNREKLKCSYFLEQLNKDLVNVD